MQVLTDQLRELYLNKSEQLIRYSARYHGCPIDERAMPEAIYHRACDAWTADGYIEKPTTFTNIKNREQQLALNILPGIKQ
jgi:hypothetical protein